MAVRTTPALVAGIIEADATIGLDPFIFTASELVTEVCAIAGYTVERLELIERWLSAHFYAIRDPRTTNEKAGSVGATYESKVDLNLALTRYGQQAMVLDTKGGLAQLNIVMSVGRRKVGVTWVGTNTDDATLDP
jgi:hypothetical protein